MCAHPLALSLSTRMGVKKGEERPRAEDNGQPRELTYADGEDGKEEERVHPPTLLRMMQSVQLADGGGFSPTAVSPIDRMNNSVGPDTKAATQRN